MDFEQKDSLRQKRFGLLKSDGKPQDAEQMNSSSSNIGDLNKKDPFSSGDREVTQGRQIGYIRVSTKAQMTDRQTMHLKSQCDELHIEHVSAVAAERPVFDEVLRKLKPNDALVVLDLDRAFRSSIDAMLIAEQLRQRGVRFRILTLNIDTQTAEGELFYTILAAFAQFERRIISRRTKEGMAAAKKRGSKIGRPTALAPEVIHQASVWIEETGLPCRYVAALLGVSRLTLQRGFKQMKS